MSRYVCEVCCEPSVISEREVQMGASPLCEYHFKVTCGFITEGGEMAEDHHSVTLWRREAERSLERSRERRERQDIQLFPRGQRIGIMLSAIGLLVLAYLFILSAAVLAE